MTTHTHRFCIAPMIDWSDRHCRYFWRLLTKNALLYTEMITTGAILHGDQHRHLAFNQAEHPLALQLGGSNPNDLALAAKIGEDYGYDEINLNVGCPSDRVQSGAFGACLMLEPNTVAECIHSMQEAVSIPVTIKCRIGVDERDSYEELQHFIAINQQAGCQTFIIHARKAWLRGLSPKENREIPPLCYPTVYQLKRDFPSINFILNGGIKTLDQCHTILEKLDGVMIGREAYQNPWLLHNIDAELFNAKPRQQSPHSIALRYAEYIQSELADGNKLHHMTRHILGLFNGQPGARKFRRHLSEQANQSNAGIDVLHQALDKLTAA